MTAENIFVDYVKNDVYILLAKFGDECTKLEAYIDTQKQAGKSTVHYEIRLNNYYNLIGMVHKLIQLANNAVSELPAKTNNTTQIPFNYIEPIHRERICDKEYSDKYYLKEILVRIENLENNLL